MTIAILPASAKVDDVLRSEMQLRRLARDLAIGLIEPADVLTAHGIDEDQWHRVAHNKVFQDMLREEMVTWRSPMNARQRVELRTWSMIEEALPQLYSYLHDPQFADAAKVSLFTALQKQVGVGVKDGQVSEAGQKISINIVTGGDNVSVEHVTPKVIEGEAVDVSPRISEQEPA